MHVKRLLAALMIVHGGVAAAQATAAQATAAQPAAAQAVAAQATAADYEARKNSIGILESQIGQRENRMAEMAEDIITLDRRIEKRVDELVKMLAGMSDSQDSRTKVSRMKQDAIAGLKRGIDLYIAKRRELREGIRSGGNDIALGDLGKFDQRVFKRVDQIVELSKSFPIHTDIKKYEDDGGGDYWRGYDSGEISEAWRQNRRDTRRGGQTRDDTTEALRKGIKKLDQRRRALKELLANAKLNPSEKKLYIQELGQIDAYTDRLNSELVEATTTSSGTSRKPSLDEALDVEELITEARKTIREDVANMFRLYTELDRGRAKTEQLKANLAARMEWLKKNSPPPAVK